MRTLVTCVLSFILAVGMYAAQSDDGLWSDIQESQVSSGQERLIIPVEYRTLRLNLEFLGTVLRRSPMEGSIRLKESPVTIALPLPDGGFGRFSVVESPIMAPELAIRYPEIRTYLGQGIDDPTATVRFDVTPEGFHAMILSAGPTIYIDPYSRGNTQVYISYFKHSARLGEARNFEEIDVVDPGGERAKEIAQLVASRTSSTRIGEELRTYRVAVACTGEYAAFHGGTVPLALAAVVVAVNRVNGIYEREVAVRMQLVANNDQIIYTNSGSDPYSNNNGVAMLGQNQTTLDNIIGSANYDFGHVFSTGGGGVAGLGVICRNGEKAEGVTGLPSPIGDPFYVDYVAHEMGHQFGANHSFNGTSGACGGGNRNAGTAYEPGSGSTIMAYAGICGAHNTQNFSDDYFHGISTDEIVAYTTIGVGSGCPVITFTGNNPPGVDANPTGYSIPIGTPFSLPGVGNDVDGDSLTYTWEEFDLGPGGSPNAPTGNAPIFRSFKGTGNPTRTFPRMSDILNNTQTIGELLPSYARLMIFRLTVRDNRAGGGGVGSDATGVDVIGTAGPFVITSPNTSVTWLMNSTDTVRWNVANTNQSPINCSSVNILLSTNGGQTFPTVLAANTPNDGAQAVTIPNILNSTARIKVEAVGNVFFDISNVNFSIGSVGTPQQVSPANASTNLPLSVPIRWRSVAGAATYHLQVATEVAFTTLQVNDSTLTDTSRIASGLLNNRLYYWRVRGKNAQGTSGWSDVWNFRTVVAPPNAPTLTSPANNSINLASTLTLQWGVVFSVTGYSVEVSQDSLFSTTVVNDTTLTVNQKIVSLASGTRYFWRARAKNAGGFGATSAVWNFTTQQLPGQVSLVSPANGTSVAEDSVLLVWQRAGTANERYWLHVSTDSLFTTGTVDSTLTDSSRMVRQLIASQTYWWKVRAGNNAGWGVFSEPRNFSRLATSVGEIEPGIPSEFVLSQNYPNPFNPSTVISYALPREIDVRLEVFNLLGERVALLVDEKMSAGYHSAIFDALGLSSGLYLYRLQAGEFEQTRKLTLVR
ncbi:MAG: reprolysin-like metallopeptidase [Bacteroidota bacterium]